MPTLRLLRRAELIGRPIDAPAFLDTIARHLGRPVAPGKRGRKPRNDIDGAIKKEKYGRVTNFTPIFRLF